MIEIISLLFIGFILGLIAVTLYKQIFHKRILIKKDEEEIDNFSEKDANYTTIADIIEKIELLAKILYKQDYPKFGKKLISLQKSKNSIFKYKHDYYNNPFKSKNYDDYYNIEDYLLTRANYDGKIEAIDYKGEDDKNQIFNYVKKRLKDYEIENFNTILLKKELDNLLQNNELNNYQFVIKQFELLSEKLNEINFKLLFIDEGSDTYYPFIVNNEDFKLLNGYNLKNIKIINYIS